MSGKTKKVQSVKSRKEELLKKGFLGVSGVLSPETVEELRQECRRIFDQGVKYAGDTRYVRNNICDRYPILGNVIFNETVLEFLRGLLGEDFVFFPEMAAHDSFFGGWHTDTSTQEAMGHLFHREGDYETYNLGFYLQNNGRYGGGLDVIPGSHVLPDPYIQTVASAYGMRSGITRFIYKSAFLTNSVIHLRKILKGAGSEVRADHIQSENPEPESYSIPSKAGDMLLFDTRLRHKATWPEEHIVPDQHRKFFLTFIVSRNNRHVSNYFDFLRSRDGFLKGHRYSPEFLERCKNHSVNLVGADA